MNHIYRLIWSAQTGTWIAVAEICPSRGKRSLLVPALAFVLGGAAGSGANAEGLPTGGQIAAGNGMISQSGSTMTIHQGSPKLAIDWQDFSIGQGHSVNFVQPSGSAVALNRVTGSNVSKIQGALNANGQIFLVNPNGILFTPSAQVNTGGLVASTLGISNEDFLSGRYEFSGNSSNAVVNQGNITVRNGGNLALIAARVSNSGTLTADQGSVTLGAGSKVLLDMGGPVKLVIEQGAIDALIDNGGAIRAEGGTVLLSARAAGELMQTVINNSGVIEAKTLADGSQGQIALLGDMSHGRIAVGGSLDASARNGGDGGHIETSGAEVNTLPGLSVNAGSALGRGGEWLVDPYNYTIDATAAGNIVSALNLGTSVTITTQSASASYGGTVSGVGDITLSSPIAKNSGGNATLTLQADHSIFANSDITSTSGKLNIVLSAANASGATSGGVNLNANLNSNGGNILIGGGTGTVSNGIGYALILDTSSPAVVIQQGKSISSGGGSITVNGQTSNTTSSYSGTKAGVYVRANASLNSGGGNMYLSGISTGDTKEFGFAVEGGSGTVTTFTTGSSSGLITVDAWNTLNTNGALGLLNNGNQTQVLFTAPSVAGLLFKINGSSQLTTFTIRTPCSSAYPNCGTLVVPGSNGSYLEGSYQVVDMATNAMYVFTGNGSKTYDGTTTATGLSLTTTGAPAGFSTSGLTFTTSSKNAGSYATLTGGNTNPGNYTSGGVTYAIGYFNGTYTINPKTLTPVASNKVYDGTTNAAIGATGIVGGDSVQFSYSSGAFSSKNAGTWAVTASGIALTGVDAANYTLGANTSVSATATISARSVNLTGSRVYDGTTAVAAGIFTLGNLVAGENLTLSGSGSVAGKNVANGASVTAGTLALGNGGNGLASNYTLSGGTLSASITPATLTVSGLSAQNKVYDGTTTASLTGSAALAGVIGSDAVTLSGNPGSGGLFADANAGAGKMVTVATGGVGLAGADAGNYQLGGFSVPLTATISARSVNLTGSRVYDGTTAVAAGIFTLGNLVAGESLTLSGSGSVAGKNVANGASVTAGTLALGNGGNGLASNYTLSGGTLSASITPTTLTLSGLSAQNKVYDGTTTASLTGSAALAGVIGGDTVTLGGSLSGA
ncbi:YDG domain-containing protein, partial [Paludibacterium paludis]